MRLSLADEGLESHSSTLLDVRQRDPFRRWKDGMCEDQLQQFTCDPSACDESTREEERG